MDCLGERSKTQTLRQSNRSARLKLLHLNSSVRFASTGTGAIGTYYNFLRAMPLRCGVDEFLSRCAGAGLDAHRCTLAAERAAPGLYSCVLCESNVAAEVTVGAFA
jgi:hypothetical protein